MALPFNSSLIKPQTLETLLLFLFPSPSEAPSILIPFLQSTPLLSSGSCRGLRTYSGFTLLTFSTPSILQLRYFKTINQIIIACLKPFMTYHCTWNKTLLSPTPLQDSACSVSWLLIWSQPDHLLWPHCPWAQPLQQALPCPTSFGTRRAPYPPQSHCPTLTCSVDFI